ncbi:CGGC domain-containing protein [Ruminococcaceae bacterium OttesenSCG-928-D13]|nr:CGGC domain-containing protein [Ruminococcaceae bacterium OttesenSCG-928-D13]
MKLGLIRCLQTEDMCPMGVCLKTVSKKGGAFSGIDGDITITGINTCGGCPGKKAVSRAALMVKQGAEAIALCSCIEKGTPIGFACPHKEEMLSAIKKKVGSEITIFEYTHD